MIKAVIFDCFGVLTGDKWKEFVATLPQEQVNSAYDLNHALDRGDISQDEFFKQIVDLTGESLERVESTTTNNEMNKNLPLLKFIQTLKPTYKIGLLSNISSNWVRETFLTTEENLLFDDVVLSYEVGLIKPDPAIFELAAERLGYEPSECLFIDDSPGHCAGAAQTGMRSIVYKNFVQFHSEISQLL